MLEPLLVKAFNLEVDRQPELNLEKLELSPVKKLTTQIHAPTYAKFRCLSNLEGQKRT